MNLEEELKKFPTLSDLEKELAKNFYRIGLLHAADQDEKANKGAFISQSLEYSATMHRQAAQEVK